MKQGKQVACQSVPRLCTKEHLHETAVESDSTVHGLACEMQSISSLDKHEHISLRTSMTFVCILVHAEITSRKFPSKPWGVEFRG
jgi:hypothetical protein